MRKLKIILGILLLSNSLFSQVASFYIAPHQDDIALFMANNLIKDYRDESGKIVYIFVTNGDPTNIDLRYTIGRNEGAKESIRFVVDHYSQSETTEKIDTVIFNSHKIERFSYGDLTAYFMNLPCSDVSYSISKAPLGAFMLGTIDSVFSTNKLAIYKSWKDLENTFSAIVTAESKDMNRVYLNAHDFDTKIDPNDHPDHNITGTIINDVSLNKINYTIRYYNGYTIHNKLSNLDVNNETQKAAQFAAYDYGIRKMYNPNRSYWDPQHIVWLSRTYFRTQDQYNNIITNIENNKTAVFAKDGILYINSDSSIDGVIRIYDSLGHCVLTKKINNIDSSPTQIGILKSNSIFFYQIDGSKHITGKFHSSRNN